MSKEMRVMLLTLAGVVVLLLAAYGGYVVGHEAGHEAGRASVDCPAAPQCTAEQIQEAVREGRSFLGIVGGLLEGDNSAGEPVGQ